MPIQSPLSSLLAAILAAAFLYALGAAPLLFPHSTPATMCAPHTPFYYGGGNTPLPAIVRPQDVTP